MLLTHSHARTLPQSKTNSIVFNTFIFLQVFNMINSRKIEDEYNVFGGMFTSPIFVAVLIIIVALQVGGWAGE